jgi:hypothetical protein
LSILSTEPKQGTDNFIYEKKKWGLTIPSLPLLKEQNLREICEKKKKTYNPPAVTIKNTKSKYLLNTLWIKRAYMIRKRDNTSMIIELLLVNHTKQIIKGWSLKSQSITKPKKKTQDSDQRSNDHEMITKTLECDQRREWKGWSFTSEHPLEREREGDSMFVCWVWEWRDRCFLPFL